MTKTERLILANQFKILAHLEPENESSYRENIEILEKGFSIFFDNLTMTMYDELSKEDGELVLDTLDLYRATFYFKKNGGDLHELKNTEFMGFDGNYETEHLSFVEFLICTQGKYQELLNDCPSKDFNSHTPMIPRYTKYVNRWKKELGKKWPESTQDFEKIFDKVDEK